MILETAAFISISSWIGNKILDKGFDHIFEKINSKDFNEKFYKKINGASLILQKKYPEALGGNIQYLFENEDVFNELIKLLFFDAKINLTIIENNFDSKTLDSNFLLDFIETLRKELYKDSFFREILENKQIFLTIVGIDRNIVELVEVSEISQKEIISIKNILEKYLVNTISISNFIDAYKTCLINNFSQLNFIGLGLDLTIKKGKRKKLEDLFVKPNFTLDENDKKKLIETNLEIDIEQEIELSQIFNFENNLVILGNPGSGKSILTKYITLKLIQKEYDTFDNDKTFDKIPFRIELRKYHAFKKDEKEGITKYLRFLLELEFSFSNITTENIEQILLGSESIIIFDGLDEIFDINDKLEVKNDIENFILNYKKAQIIVTSRLIGYNDAAIKEELAIKISINKFDDFQIEKYIRNWYSVEEDDDDVRYKEIEDLLSKKNLIDQELISNPLLLSLIVILYRNNLKVPESKLEIYQSCTKTLVDKWDHSKGIKIDLSEEIYKRKDTIFADLAFWQYNELSSKNGKVTYQRAKNTVAKTLNEKLQISDEFTSDDYADKFLEYAERRSLYFDNNFTHKTFLEYFTAFWIFSNIEKKHKKKERDALIKKYVTSPYWHIVLELLMNLIDKDQADNEIIDDLISFQIKSNIESSLFFLQIYTGIQNVSSSIYEQIIEISIRDILKNESNYEDQKFKSLRDKNISPFFILSEHFKNELLRTSIEKVIREIFIKDDEIDQKTLLTFYLEISRDSNELKEENLVDKNNEIYKLFPNDAISKVPINFILHTLLLKSSSFVKNPIIYTEQYLKNFGVKSFQSNIRSSFSDFSYFPFQLICLRDSMFNSDHRILNEFIEITKQNNIKIKDLISSLFKFHLFNKNEDDFKTLINNFNYINDKSYIILLIPIFYSNRIRNNFISRNHEKVNFSIILGDLSDKEMIKHLQYIIDPKHHRRMTMEYIIGNFDITENMITR